MIIRLLNKAIKPLGLHFEKLQKEIHSDITSDGEFMRLYLQCKPYTMTSIERMYCLYQSLNYIIENKIPGDCVECGVWKGGSSMLMALVLKEKGETWRKIYLYDTFEGMSEPTETDKNFLGEPAKKLLETQEKNDNASVWCYSSMDEVSANLSKTAYPIENLILIKGKVEETLNTTLPNQVALLRLDTDWYESTKIELQRLFPLTVTKGVVIFDDFGHWEGAKKAVMEYFSQSPIKPLLQRIDETGRIMVKD